ncbi:MAG: polysaccharide deacetylase family protein [Dorea sp.]|nr:polysaccharide deacetylase family protein [Dorea sp.]
MKKVLCLLYHRVHPVEDEIFHLTVSPEHFEQQMEYLHKYYPIFRFEDEWAEPGEDGIVVTFDDGYGDNLDYALPILEKYHIPATIFVTTGYVNGNQEYWWDELARILTRDLAYPDRFELKDSLYRYTWETDSLEKRVDMLRSLHWLLKLDDEVERANSWLEQLRRWAGVGLEGRKENLPADLNGLHALAQSEYITIGGHTVNHRSLGAQTKEHQQYEIGASVRFLEKELGKKIEVFSYPFGSRMHFNEDTFDVCRQCGIKKAASTLKGIWIEGMHPYTVPRMEVKDDNGEEFGAFLQECWRYGR